MSKIIRQLNVTAFIVVSIGTQMPALGQQPTHTEIEQVRRKIISAQGYFNSVWSAVFASRGSDFRTPRVIAFSDSYETACGKAKAGDAFYCPRDNNIYLEAAFLAGEVKRAAGALHTDGTMPRSSSLPTNWATRRGTSFAWVLTQRRIRT